MSLDRRAILRTLTVATGFAALGAFAHWLQRFWPDRFPLVQRPYAPAPGLLRPPGALSEGAFLAACIRCYRCQDVCAPGAIQFYSEADGALYHTPYIDPAKAGCTLCNKCGPICPTGALVPIDDPADVDMGSVELRQNLCLSYKAKQLRHEQELLGRTGGAPIDAAAEAERRGPCGECFTFCPLRNRAIQLEPGRFLTPRIFPEYCVGCGMCEEICRTMVRGEPAIRVVRTRRPAGREVPA